MHKLTLNFIITALISCIFLCFLYTIFSASIFFALLPIIWLLIGLVLLRLQALFVCSTGLILSLFIACRIWDFSPFNAAGALADGAMFAIFPILWVIISAFFVYNISLHTGANKQIQALAASISPDSRVQALIIAWGLGSFMESVAGFGTAVVIPAAMLIALGFKPLTAAIVALLANTIAVAFGVIGIPMQTLVMVTDLNVTALSTAASIQLLPLTLLVPFCIVGTVTKSFKRTLEVWLPTLTAGAVFAAIQFTVAINIGPELAAVAASICSILAMVLIVRLFPIKTPFNLQNNTVASVSTEPAISITLMGQLKAWSPYIILFFLVLLSSKIVPLLHETLTAIKSTLYLYTGTGGKPLTIHWLTTPGTIMLIAGIAGGLWQGATPLKLITIYGQSLKKLTIPCLTIICIVCMAKVLSYSGMMMHLSTNLASGAGTLYPIMAPFIGALGSFITGSDTSSNLLFGALQKETALHLGLNPVWIAAANTSGACIGKLLSLQNITLAAVATGLEGQEKDLFNIGSIYAIPFLAFLSWLVYILLEVKLAW